MGSLVYKSDADVQLGTRWHACADLFCDVEKSAAGATQTLLGTSGRMHRRARTRKGVLCAAGWVLLGPSCAHTMVQLLWDRLLWAAGAAAGWSWCCLSSAQPWGRDSGRHVQISSGLSEFSRSVVAQRSVCPSASAEGGWASLCDGTERDLSCATPSVYEASVGSVIVALPVKGVVPRGAQLVPVQGKTGHV